MYIKDKYGDSKQDVLVIEKPAAIRLLFSEKHNRILKKLTESEMSISDLARSLSINPGSVHYHLKELEKQGLVRQVREEVKGGIVKKYYRSVARRICVESPDFDEAPPFDVDLAGHPGEEVLNVLEQLGYATSDERRADARDMLALFDRRIKALFDELHAVTLRAPGEGGMPARQAVMFLVHMRAMHDPEMAKVNSQFTQLFYRVE